MKLAETERRVMTLIWDQEGITAKELAAALEKSVGWNKTTTYTVITRCMEKNYIRRENPKFHCYSLISREEVAQADTDALIDFSYQGRPDLLVAALVGRNKLSLDQIKGLYDALREVEDEK